jgi:hypothetical protein
MKIFLILLVVSTPILAAAGANRHGGKQLSCFTVMQYGGHYQVCGWVAGEDDNGIYVHTAEATSDETFYVEKAAFKSLFCDERNPKEMKSRDCIGRGGDWPRSGVRPGGERWSPFYYPFRLNDLGGG